MCCTEHAHTSTGIGGLVFLFLLWSGFGMCKEVPNGVGLAFIAGEPLNSPFGNALTSLCMELPGTRLINPLALTYEH